MKINKIIFFTLLFITGILTILEAKIIVMVNKNYYHSDTSYVNRFIRETKSIDGIHAILIEYDPLPGNDIFYVWQVLRDHYAAARPTKDPVEGAILVGDIPRPVYSRDPVNLVKIPCEYFYMDLWNTKPGADTAWNKWSDIWSKWTTHHSILDRTSYIGKGDDRCEIWVSRIYASNLHYLRKPGAPWGTFLKEYEIINNYFERVHERMTLPAKVPNRGFCMGPPPTWTNKFGRDFMDMDTLHLEQMFYFDYSNPQEMNLNQAAAWQAQLQAGPYGNKTRGSINGKRFDNPLYQRDCRTHYTGDTKGYEWAGFFAHSKPTFSGFHQYYPKGTYTAAGYFFNINSFPLWKEIAGGYSGKYYEWTHRISDPGGDPHKQGTSNAYWTCVIDSPGTYTVEMYIPYDSLNSEYCYYNLYRASNGSEFINIGGGSMDQKVQSDGWKTIHSTYPQWSTFSFSENDTIAFEFVPNYPDKKYSSKYNKCAADAVRFNMNNGYNITIKTTDIFNLNKLGNRGFRCANWYNRAFYNMQDDGGQSKVHFFMGAACQINNYLYEDNIGLLYAMGHQGLIMMGNAYDNSQDNDFLPYTGMLKTNNNFGAAYLNFVNSYYPDPDDNFILFGSGSLKPQPYHPYDQSFWESKQKALHQ